MANDVELDPGSGGAVMATDEIVGASTVHWPYVKPAFGPDNTATIVTSTVGMPVKVLSGPLELGKVEDTAHSTGDVGVMMLGVRNDTLTAIADADGDYSALQVNGDGALYVRAAGHVSTVNSSSTPLGISGVFTGTAEEITHYSSVSVSVFTDEDSASGGLSLQFSTDGINWDNTEGHDITAGVHHFVGGMGEGKWFRVVYTNGTTAQGAFRLQVILRNAPLAGEVEPIDHTLEGGEDAMLVRAVITAQKPDTTYTNVQSTSAGNLKVALEENGAQVATSGGTDTFRSIDLDQGALEVAKASAGQVYWIHCMNLASSVRYLKIYDATSGTIGTGTPKLTFPIPTQGDSNGAGFFMAVPNGIEFSTGISLGASTGIADADTGAPGANEVIVNMGYA